MNQAIVLIGYPHTYDLKWVDDMHYDFTNLKTFDDFSFDHFYCLLIGITCNFDSLILQT